MASAPVAAACLALLAGLLLPFAYGQICEGPCFKRAAIRPPLDETHTRLARAADADPHAPEQVRCRVPDYCQLPQNGRPTRGAPTLWTATVRRRRLRPGLLLRTQPLTIL